MYIVDLRYASLRPYGLPIAWLVASMVACAGCLNGSV